MASTTRQALLQALSAAEGAYISGQQLAQQLGVSRAAVHKAAAALTAQGYALEAASRRGYRLLGGDPFCTEAVGPYPAPVQLYDTLESTNRTAKLLALEGAVHGTLVLAGGQTAGRGRLGRSFTSPAGKGVYDDPLLKARMEDCRLRGGDPFDEVQLPEAVITLKQGVGRLIRDIDDRGVLVICDNRLVMRPYGAVFLASLPPAPRTRDIRRAVRFLAVPPAR